MFRALCAYHQDVEIALYSIWYHHTCRWQEFVMQNKQSKYINTRTPR